MSADPTGLMMNHSKFADQLLADFLEQMRRLGGDVEPVKVLRSNAYRVGSSHVLARVAADTGKYFFGLNYINAEEVANLDNSFVAFVCGGGCARPGGRTTRHARRRWGSKCAHLLERGADPHRVSAQGMTFSKMLKEHRKQLERSAPPAFTQLWDWAQAHGMMRCLKTKIPLTYVQRDLCFGDVLRIRSLARQIVQEERARAEFCASAT